MKTGIFVENSCKLRSNFVDSLKNNVESSVEGLDFKHNSSEARDYLNHWVKKHTNGKIKELFPPGNWIRKKTSVEKIKFRFRHRVHRCVYTVSTGKCDSFHSSVGQSVRFS